MAAIHGFWNAFSSVVDLLTVSPPGPKLSCATETVTNNIQVLSLSVLADEAVYLAVSLLAAVEVA